MRHRDGRSNAELKSGLRQERRTRAPADVVDTRIADAFAGDVGDQRGVELSAVELAEHNREIGTLRIPSGLEIRTEFDLRRTMRPTHGNPPAVLRGSHDVLFRYVREKCS